MGLPFPAIHTAPKTSQARVARYEVNWSSDLARGLVGLWLPGDIRSKPSFAVDITNNGAIIEGSNPEPLTFVNGHFCWDFDSTIPRWNARSDEKLKFEHQKPFTVSAWIRYQPGTDRAILARMDANSGYRGYDMWINPYGEATTVSLHMIDAWPGNGRRKDFNIGDPSGSWHLMCYVYDGSVDLPNNSLFWDGIRKTAFRQDGSGLNPGANIVAPTPFGFGSRSNHSGRYDGFLGMVAAWNRELSDSEIKTLYEQTRYGGYGELVSEVPEISYVFLEGPTHVQSIVSQTTLI